MFNTRVSIVKKLKEFDDDGYRIEESKKEYKEVYSCWAKVNNLYGKELYDAYNVGLETILNIKIRYCKLLKELFIDNENGSRDYKVKWNNAIYDIITPDFLNFNKKEVILKVKRST